MAEAIFYPRAQEAIERGTHHPFDLYGYLGETLAAIRVVDEPIIVELLDYSYKHGGGWNDFNGFTLHGWDTDHPKLRYPDDPMTEAVCYWQVGATRVILFDHAWVAVAKSNTDFRVARMD